MAPPDIPVPEPPPPLEPAPTAHVTLRWVPPPAEKREPKGIAEHLLNSSVVVALITTLVGGIAAQYVVSRYQAAEKQREREIAAYSQQIVKQQDAVQHAYDLLGAQISSAEDLIAMTSRHFDTTGLTGRSLELLTKQREEMMTRYNTLGRAWRAETLKTGMLLTYNHKNPGDVTAAWNAGMKGVEAFQSCADDHYRRYLDNPKVTSDDGKTCAKERDEVDAKLVTLQSVLAAGRP
jgi:hypothetical protein